MPCRRPALATVSLVLALSGPLAAQAVPGASSRPDADTADVLVLDHDFSPGVGEIVRIFLESRQVYRAELSSPDVTLVLRAVGGRIRAPRVYPFLNSDSPSGASIVEVYPDVDGEFEIRPATIQGSGVATRLRMFRDVRGSRRRAAILDAPGWEIGLELAGGWHSGFAQGTGTRPASAGAPHAGTDVEACFSARSAPGMQRLSMCVVGVGYQSQVGAPSILWIYTEPRVRILGNARRGRSNWEAGGLFRLGVGSVDRAVGVPFILSPGAYIARHVRTNPSGAGWSMHAAYSYGSYFGFAPAPGGNGVRRPHNARLTLGLGWYQ